MAGNKANTKAKTKDDKTKMNKGHSTNNSNDELEDCDLSLLRKPVQTSISSFAQARKIYDVATEELKSLLSNECDLLYECKVCKNIFRSVVNLLSHKRIYCKEKYNSSEHGRCVKSFSLIKEVSKIRQVEDAYQESIRNAHDQETLEENRIPLTKDLTTVVEEITKAKGVPDKDIKKKIHNVTLQTIRTSKVAMFQNINLDGDDSYTDIRTEVKELDDIFSKDKAVLQPDGEFSIESSIPNSKDGCEAENVIQISDDDEVDEGKKLKCKICNVKLSTQKTLKFHMKSKHVDSRLVYPCPDCFDTFATSWSVYRHLYKVHRKSTAQIRRQRESIQAKAFRMNNPPAYYEKRRNNIKAAAASKVTNVEKFDRENQAWMDNMEGDGEVPRCGGCGRTFERRAALAAHTHTCQPRNRALARRPLDSKKIEIQIRKDYNKGPAQVPQNNSGPFEASNTQVNTEEDENMETDVDHGLLKTSFKTENATNDIPENKLNLLDSGTQNASNKIETANLSNVVENNEKSLKEKGRNANVTEKIESQDAEESINTTKDVIKKNDDRSDLIKEINTQKIVSSNSHINQHNLPFYKHVEEKNIAGLKQKMEPDIDADQLQCIKCSIKFVYMHELCYHMACHYKWKRYSCKLCNFKHYLFDAVIEHNKTVHKLKGDREFYYTTVKALDAADAIDPNTVDEVNDSDITNIVSRRPSRCSNDSNRSSDDSSICTRTEIVTNKRKRKIPTNQSNYTNKVDSPITPKKAETAQSTKMPLDKVMEIILGDPETPTKSISDPEHSKDDNLSDIEDPAEKSAKKLSNEESILSARLSRPIRKRSKLKNEDFEYDLSNLLKLEAQGYREQQVNVNTRSVPVKRKPQNDSLNSDAVPNTKELLNTKDVSGMLLNMSRKAVEESRAHLKLYTTSSPLLICNNINIRRVAKSIHAYKAGAPSSIEDQNSKSESAVRKAEGESPENKRDINSASLQTNAKNVIKKPDIISDVPNDLPEDNLIERDKSSETSGNKTDSTGKANVVTNSGNSRPLISQKSLEVLKNPLVTQNISDFSKVGMTTKILVIKPVNRAKVKQDIVNGPLKLKTIKIKDIENKSRAPAIEQMKIVKIAAADSNPVSKDKSDGDSDKSKPEVPKKQNVPSKSIESNDNV